MARMIDCISRGGLINNLKKFASDRFDAMINQLIISEPSIPVNEWVDCNNEMPEAFKKVLVAHKNGIAIAWHNGNYWTRGAAAKQKSLKTVTHWMELPNLPKRR